MKEKILEYEKRLLEDRQRLIELTEEGRQENSLLYQNKLYYFRQELNYMTHQLEALKKEEMAQSKAASAPQIPVTQPLEQVSLSNYPVSQLVKQRPGVNPPVVNTVAPNNQRADRVYAKSAEKKDIEKTIGKSLMGIFASVLIFISLILFATVVMRNMGDVIKVAAIYLVSVGFTAVGLFKMQKDRGNLFYVAITGCGAGAIYISLFLTNAYFRMIDDIVLYFLLALWALGVCALAKYQNKVFRVIGQCGVTIAVIFGCILCVSTGDFAKLMVLTVFCVVASNLFYVISFEKVFTENSMHHIFHIINGFALYMACRDLIGEEPYALIMVLVIVVLIHMGIIFRNHWEPRTISYGLVTAGYTILLALCTAQIIEDDYAYGIIMYAITVLISIGAEWKVHKINQQNGVIGSIDTGKELLQLALLVVGMIVLLPADLEAVWILLCVVLPFMVLGYLWQNPIYKFGAGIVHLGYIIFAYPDAMEISIFCQLGILALAHGLMYVKKELYTKGYKIWIYILTQLFVVIQLESLLGDMFDSYEAVDVTGFIVVVFYNLAMRKIFATDFRTGQPEKPDVYNITNVFLMINGMGYIANVDDGFLHLLVIMATLVSFMVNVKNLLDKAKGMGAGIYVGIKFTILMIVILASFDAENYIVSVFCFLFAIISVSTGFLLRYKSLRIYGIVLSMLSIFKLLMLDINYENTLGNALSFFASGMLCFAISMIYNYVDKRFSQDEENRFE